MGLFKNNSVASRFISNYGMVVVLILLCIYYSWATLKKQDVVGQAAGVELANELRSTLSKGGNVLIAGNVSSDDQQFADELERRLADGPVKVVGKVLGTPQEIRKAIQKIADAGGTIDVIAATEASAKLPVFQKLGDKFPKIGAAKMMSPSSFTWPTFLLTSNLLNVANQAVVISLLAVGMTMVIITGGIDLSVGSMVALSAVVTTLMIQKFGGATATTGQMIGGVLIGIGMCAAVGAVTGGLITLFKLPPFIATLGMMQVASGFAYIISNGQSIYDIPESFVWLGRGTSVWAIPNAVVLMLVTYAIAHVLMSRTTLGRYIYAVGGNVEAARLSGVRVRKVLLFVYIVSGAMAGLGGVVVASQLKSGAPTYGLMYELYAIAAVVVGGTSLSGGSGKILGTLIGAFIIAVIQNGMNLTQTESYRQKVVLGLIILAAVMIDMVRKHGRRIFQDA